MYRTPADGKICSVFMQLESGSVFLFGEDVMWIDVWVNISTK